LFVMQSVIRRLNAPPLSSQFNNATRLRAALAEEARLQSRNAESGAAQRTGDTLNDAIRRAPEDTFLYEGAANTLEATGYKDQAIAAYRELLKRLPGDFYGQLQLGRLLRETGKPGEARPLLEAATRGRPSQPDAWHELGQACFALGQFAPALDCTLRTLELRPQDPANHCYHGKVLAKLKRRPEALASFRRALELKPDFWEARFELAGELAWDNQIAEAAREYVEVLKIAPNHAVTHINLGTLLVRANRLDEAIQHFETALKLDPNSQPAREYLAQVRERQRARP
jgi:tetratricopeptide (TPR) repeat protein